LLVSRRLPLSGFSVHRANRAGLSARCARPFFLSPKIHLKGRQLPAVRGFFQISFCFCNAEKRNLATGGAENFSFHSLQHRILKFAKRGRQPFSGFTYLLRVSLRFCQMDNKKAANLFQTYCFRWPLVAADIQFFLIGQIET
ncbi:MAG: hypothetical protein ACLS5M_15840, partial [Ruminococcus sp.]